MEAEEEGEIRGDSRGETEQREKEGETPAEQKHHSQTVSLDVIYRHIASRFNWGEGESALTGNEEWKGKSCLLA